MIKLVDPASFDHDCPIMSLVDVHSKGVDSQWLNKTAAVMTKELAAIRPEAGKTFMHLIALGDFEKTGANRNADSFPAAANKAYHDTFVKHANFYRHHKNKPAKGDKIYGDVRHSAYNEKMGRVELIIGIDNVAAPDTIQKIASGKDVSVSMACRIKHDSCSICENRAKTAADYCEHITKHAGQLMADGRQIYMRNDHPTFFDISEVSRPADRTAYMFNKIASAASYVELSAVLAEEQHVTGPLSLASPSIAKYASTLESLYRIEHEIRHNRCIDTIKLANCMAEPMGVEHCPPEHTGAAFKHLRDARVSLPIEDFMSLILGSKAEGMDSSIGQAKASMPEVFSDAMQDPEEFISGVGRYESEDTPIPHAIKDMLQSTASSGSSMGDPLQSKVLSVQMKKANSRILPTIVTKTGKSLAKEYARYKLAYLRGLDNRSTRLSVLQNFG